MPKIISQHLLSPFRNETHPKRSIHFDSWFINLRFSGYTLNFHPRPCVFVTIFMRVPSFLSWLFSAIYNSKYLSPTSFNKSRAQSLKDLLDAYLCIRLYAHTIQVKMKNVMFILSFCTEIYIIHLEWSCYRMWALHQTYCVETRNGYKYVRICECYTANVVIFP